MAGVTVNPPPFGGHIDEDLNIFIRRFRGFLNGIGIDPVGNQRERAIGLFRSCLHGPAGDWYDRNIDGKNWKLNNIYDNHGQGGMGNLRGRTMQQMRGTNSFRLHSLASTFANIPGNNAVTVGDPDARMIPAEAFDEDWTNSGGEPTDEPENAFVGNNNPIVLRGIHIGQAIDYIKKNYPTVLEEKRKVRFANLVQDNEPIREFYDKLKKYGSLLNYSNEIIERQFFMGLSPENQIEIERIGPDKSIEELVKALERVEKRKSEMKLGLGKRTKIHTYYDQSQETKPQVPGSLQSLHSLEDMDKIIKRATEKITQDFHTQIKELQAEIQKLRTKNLAVPVPIKDAKPFNPEEVWEKIWNHMSSDEEIRREKEDETKRHQEIFARAERLATEQQAKKKQQSHTDKIASRIAQRIEEKNLDNEIAGAFPKLFSNLDINDNSDAMDTSNLVREVATDDDEYTLQLVRKKK